MSTLGRPGDGVGVFTFDVLDDSKVTSLGVDGVEIHIILDGDTRKSLAVVGVVGGNDSESSSTGFPGEGGYIVLVFDDFDGNILLTHSE
jgi:hypothetical protein